MPNDSTNIYLSIKGQEALLLIKVKKTSIKL